MSKTNSVSILITRDSKLVKTYFGRENQFLQKSVTFTNFVEDARRDKKTLIYSTDNSKNIISLTHSTVEDNESKGNYRGLITVELIDPDLKFEEDFVRMNISEVFVDFLLETLKYVQPEQDSSFRNYISDTVASGNVTTDKFYIAYGNSDNLETWAGPFVCQFSDAQVRYSGDSARKLILYFIAVKAPMPCSLSIFDENLPLTLYRTNYYVAESKLLSSIDVNTFDFSELVYSLYEGYLRKAYSDQANVIVLLPEIKAFFLNQIKGIIDKNIISAKDRIITRGPYLLEAAAKAATGRSIPPDPNLTVNNLDKLSMQRNAIAEILSEFGIELVQADPLAVSDIRRLTSAVKEQRAEHVPKPLTSNIYASLRVNLSDKLWVQYYRPIKNLRDLLARFGFETVFFEESNIKIINAWKEAGLIQDSTKSVVILGDYNLVNDYLYGNAQVTDKNFSITELTSRIVANNSKFYHKDTQNFIVTNQWFNALLNSIIPKFSIGIPTEIYFTYDFDSVRKIKTNNELLGLNGFLRQSDLEKFRQAKLWTKLKNLTSQYVYQYGELEKTGILAIDKKLTEIDLRRGKTGNFPVFRFNIPNPNVVKLDLDSKNSYYTALFATIQRLLYDYPSRFIEPTIKPGGKTDPDTTIFRHIVEIANKFLKTGREDLEIEEAKKLVLPFINQNSLVKEKPETVATRWALVLITYIEDRKRKFGPTIELSDWDGSEILGLKKTFSDLMKQINTVRIRTLPMFQISKLSDLFSTAYLLADTVDVYGYSETIMSEVLSNEYRILGFKHFINKEECYSEFILALDPNTAGTKKMMGL